MEGKQALRTVPMFETLMLTENADSMQKLLSLWSKNMWNPGACVDLKATDF